MAYFDKQTIIKMVLQLKNEEHHANQTHQQIHNHEYANILHLLETAPTADVVEVVRCRDCKHYSLAMLKCCIPIDDKHSFDDYVPPIWQPNDFCSYGERKE